MVEDVSVNLDDVLSGVTLNYKDFINRFHNDNTMAGVFREGVKAAAKVGS